MNAEEITRPLVKIKFEKSSAILKIYHVKKANATGDDFILEQDITIDKDEVESEIEFNFKIPVDSELETVIIPNSTI